MAWRIRPVQRAAIGAPFKTIGSECILGMAADYGGPLAGVNAIQGRSIVGFGFVDRSDPETTQGITSTIVGSNAAGVVWQLSNSRQCAPPFSCAEDSVAQGQDQPPSQHWCNTAWFTGQIPCLYHPRVHVGACNLPLRNVYPIQHMFVGMPEGRFSQCTSMRGNGSPIHGRNRCFGSVCKRRHGNDCALRHQQKYSTHFLQVRGTSLR